MPGEGTFDEEETIDMGAHSGGRDVIDATAVEGAGKARAKLIPWFRAVVDSVEEEQNPLRVVLAQSTTQSGDKEITEIEHDLESPTDETIDKLLAVAVEDMCEGQFSGATVSYAIFIRRQPNQGKPARYTFVLERPSRGDALTDPPQRQHLPDAAGVIGMFMDQNLKLTQYALEGANTGKDVLLRMIDRLEEENRYLKRSQFKRDQEREILMNGNLQRQFLVDEHRARMDRDAKIGDGFKALVPQLLPLILPPNMAQSVQAAVGTAAVALNAGAPVARDPGPPQHVHGDPHIASGPSDSRIVDELVLKLEEDQQFLMKLFALMSEKPECAQLLGMLYEASNARRRAAIGQ